MSNNASSSASLASLALNNYIFNSFEYMEQEFEVRAESLSIQLEMICSELFTGENLMLNRIVLNNGFISYYNFGSMSNPFLIFNKTISSKEDDLVDYDFVLYPKKMSIYINTQTGDFYFLKGGNVLSRKYFTSDKLVSQVICNPFGAGRKAKDFVFVESTNEFYILGSKSIKKYVNLVFVAEFKFNDSIIQTDRGCNLIVFEGLIYVYNYCLILVMDSTFGNLVHIIDFDNDVSLQKFQDIQSVMVSSQYLVVETSRNRNCKRLSFFDYNFRLEKSLEVDYRFYPQSFALFDSPNFIVGILRPINKTENITEVAVMDMDCNILHTVDIGIDYGNYDFLFLYNKLYVFSRTFGECVVCEILFKN